MPQREPTGSAKGDRYRAVQVGRIDPEAGTVTLSSNAGTVNKSAGVITTEALTTAAAGTQALVITNSHVTANSIPIVTICGGTSTTGSCEVKAVPTAGTLTITLTNRHASAAFNGTFKLSFLIMNPAA